MPVRGASPASVVFQNTKTLTNLENEIGRTLMFETRIALMTIRHRHTYDSQYTSVVAPLKSGLVLYHAKRISVQAASEVLTQLQPTKRSLETHF